MKICRACGGVSAGSPAYCPRCGRSLDARFCEKDHSSSLNATFCQDCGSDDLSNASPSLRLGWLVQLLTLILGVFTLRYLLHNPFGFFSSHGLLDQASGYLLGTRLSELVGDAVIGLALLALPFVLYWLFSERAKLPSRSLASYGRLIHWLGSLAWKLLVAFVRLLWRPNTDKAAVKERASREERH